MIPKSCILLANKSENHKILKSFVLKEKSGQNIIFFEIEKFPTIKLGNR